MRALWVFVPVLGAPLLHAPVLALDLLPGLKRPLDGGASWRGRRILGDNKTWRGALVMVTGVVAAAGLLSLYDQGDFVLVVWLLLLPLWVMTPVQALIVFALVSALHLAINVIAYAIGARDTPL